MKERECFRCGKKLPAGDLVYVANIRVFADFDGVLLDPEEGVEEQMGKIFEQIQDADPDELEKEVYEEFTLILCKSCRDRFVDEAQHPWEGPLRIRKGGDDFIH